MKLFKLLMWLILKNVQISNLSRFKFIEHCEIGANTVFYCGKGIELKGDNKIGSNCSFIAESSIDSRYGKITLEKGAAVGSNSVISPDVTIGKNSILGAGSVLRKSVPNGEVWAGCPARFIRKNLEDYAKDHK